MTSAPAPPRGAGRARRAGWSRADLPLAAAVAVELLVLALLPRVVTVDGPAHVLGGWVLAHPDDPLLRRFYEVDLATGPNLLTTVLLAGLLQVSGPDGAERLLAAGHVVLLPLALRYALRGVDPRAGWLAVVAVPFTWGYLWSYGFYNFCLAVSLSLLVGGAALRRRDGWTAGQVAGLAALLLLTWSAHLLPVVVAGGLAAALGLSRTLAARRNGSPLASAGARHLLPVAAAGAPVLALTAGFALSDAGERGAPERLSLPDLLLGLVGLGKPLVSSVRWEHLPAAVVAAVLVAVAVSARRRLPRSPERDALVVTTVVVTAWYLLSPQRYGHQYGFLNDRLSTFPPLLLLLASAGPPPGAGARRRLVGLVLAAAAGLVLLRLPTEVRHQRDVAELLSVAPSVPVGSTLVRLQLWRDVPVGGPARNAFRDPLRHETSRLAVLTRSVDVGHYEADLPYFPVRFRSEVNPRRVVDPTGAGLEQLPPDVDLAAGTGVVDVVVVVGRPQAAPEVMGAPSTQRALADLQASYRQVAVSGPSGLAEVWLRR